MPSSPRQLSTASKAMTLMATSSSINVKPRCDLFERLLNCVFKDEQKGSAAKGNDRSAGPLQARPAAPGGSAAHAVASMGVISPRHYGRNLQNRCARIAHLCINTSKLRVRRWAY
jgi:hypothetical protein